MIIFEFVTKFRYKFAKTTYLEADLRLLANTKLVLASHRTS